MNRELEGKLVVRCLLCQPDNSLRRGEVVHATKADALIAGGSGG